MHDHIAGKPFIDGEPVLFCTKASEVRLVTATLFLFRDGRRVCEGACIPGYFLSTRVPLPG